MSGYISRLEDETTFKEFKNVMEVVRIAISGDGRNKPLIGVDDVKQIYSIIDSMKPLHGTGFDLFGAVYEMFASSKEKRTLENISQGVIIRIYFPNYYFKMKMFTMRKRSLLL